MEIKGDFFQMLEELNGLQRGVDGLEDLLLSAKPLDDTAASVSVEEAKVEVLDGLTQTQRDFVSDTRTWLIALIGGYGSGKTWALAAKAVYFLLTSPGLDGMVVMGTDAEFEEFWDPAFFKVMEKHHIKVLKYQRRPARIFLVEAFGHVSRIYCFSGDKKDRIRGVNVAWAVIDEIDRYPYPENAWKNAMARVRVGDMPQVAAGSTPEGYGFLFKTFADKEALKKKDRRYLSMSTYENEANLSPGFIEKLKKSYAPSEFNAYVHGRFVNLTSASVYDVFDRKKHVRDFSFHSPPNRTKTLVGMDFNVSNCNAVLAYKSNQALWVFAEVTEARDTTALCEQVLNILKETAMTEGWGGIGKLPRITAYPDATAGSRTTNAAATDLDLLQSHGFLIDSGNANPPVRDRVQAVRSSFLNARGDTRLWVHRRCGKLIECLERQAYASNGAPDKSGGWDHLNDALGYLVYWIQPVSEVNRRPRSSPSRHTPLFSPAK